MKLSSIEAMPRIILCLYILCSSIFFCGCGNDDAELVNLWVTGNEATEYGSVIEIGRFRNREQSGGGDGTVVIEFSYPYDDINTINELKFGIECGASYENGNLIWGIGHDEIVVEIK